ncbi:MAG: TIGR03936 family radical SAM-associated protein [Clostridia bacterium]|nr:TIGR03936 family radical SAM-associated protein [Clostridia bacterium]
MLVLKYSKLSDACFISHIDWLRHVSRILRRADIPVKYSQGFNPHALVFFSPPLAVGVSSVAEYLSIDADMQGDELLARYNAAVPSTLKASEVFMCAKNPNLQGVTVAADYVFDTPYKDIDLTNGFEIEYQKKGKTVRENVADKIFGAFNVDGKLMLRLAAGNTSLRPDRILQELNNRLGTCLTAADVCKTAQYVSADGRLISVDELLSLEGRK